MFRVYHLRWLQKEQGTREGLGSKGKKGNHRGGDAALRGVVRGFGPRDITYWTTAACEKPACLVQQHKGSAIRGPAPVDSVQNAAAAAAAAVAADVTRWCFLRLRLEGT